MLLKEGEEVSRVMEEEKEEMVLIKMRESSLSFLRLGVFKSKNEEVEVEKNKK